MATITSLGFSIFARERATRVFRQIGESAERMADRIERTAADTDRFAAGLERLNKVAKVSGLTFAAAGATSLVAAMAPAVAATAALPAAMLTAQAASNTLKVGLIGVGDAMSAVAEDDAEALSEALEKLAPTAQAFVKQAASMREEVVGLQQAVQNRLFAGLDQDLARLGKSLLPTARDGMVGVAGALNGIAREAAATASTPWFRGQVNQVFTGTTQVVETLRGAVDPLIRSVLMLGNAGMPLLQRFAEWIAQSSKVLANWIRLKIESGALGRVITQIGDVLTRIGRIGRDTAVTIGNVAAQSRALGDTGGNLLNTLERLTSQTAEWSRSAEGQRQAAQAFTEMGDAVESTSAVLPIFTGAMDIIAKLLGALPAGVRQAVIQMAAWAVVINLIITRLGLLRVATVASTVATKAWAGATAATAAAQQFAAGLRNINAAMAANATVATRLGAALRSQIMLWRQQAAAANVSTARIILNAAAQKIAAAATRTWAIAQAIFNAVMRANPLVLIVTVIMLVIGAVVLAYKRFESFRTLVDAVWAGIKTALATAWNFIKPIFLQIASVLVNVVGTALKWYAAYVKLVFTAVWTIISTVWNTAIKPIFNAIANVLRVILPRAFTFFQNIAKIVWIAIQIYIKIAWTLIQGYFNLIKFYVTKILAPAFTWLWKNIIVPVWNGIRWAIDKAWGIIKVIFAAIRAVITGVLAPVFRWLWNNVIKPVWNGIRDHISNVWNKGIKPAFDKIKSGVRAVRDAFSTASDGIKKIWNRVKGYAKTPVNFIIGTVYNKGIVGLVNKVAKFAGIDTRLDPIKLLARGGTLDNPARVAPMQTRGAMAIVGEGRSLYPEYVIPTDPRFRDRALALWAQAGQDLAGRSAPGKRMGGEGLMFERGGIIGKFLGGLKSFAFDKPAEMFKSTVDKLIGQIPGSGTFRDVVAGVPKKLAGSLVQWFKDKVGFGGGKGVSKALAFAKAQAGKPYIWGGVGPRGYDCSGLWSAIVNVIKGRNPYSRRFTTFSFTGGMHGPEGFIRNLHSAVRVGVTNAGVGHMAGTLGRTPVESRGSRGVVVGAGARGAEDSLFTMRYGLKADTGAATLAPGWNPVYNGTGRPEYLETPRRGGGDTHVHVHVENHGVIGSRIELQDWLARNLDDLRRQGRLPIGT